MRKYAFIFLSLFATISFAQEKNFYFTFLPEGLHFMPLKANMHEARLGILYFADNANLKLDIGNNVDLLGFSWREQNVNLTFGIEFMAYALSTNIEERRLQIDVLDGFFGGNANVSKKMDEHIFQCRFRIIHNSAHLVDGHYDVSQRRWIDNIEPIPFTRDFGEITIADKINTDGFILRYYGSAAYSTLVRPYDQKKMSYACGLELSSSRIIPKIFNRDTNLFLAYHLNVRGIPKYVGDNHILGGVKFGNWNGKGVVVYASYFAGNNYFSEYYYKKIEKFGIGFAIDFI